MTKKSNGRNGSPASPWYARGLRFECRPGCGACCTTHGEYAYVYLEPGDAARLARFLGVTRATFDRKYAALDDDEPILRMDAADCPFLDDGKCSVYDARPTQCRTFPFMREYLGRRRDWNSLRKFCPGIDCGERHELHTIRERLAVWEMDG